MATAIPALLMGIGGGIAGSIVSKAMAPKMSGASSPMPLPQAPSPNEAAAKAQDVTKRKVAAASQSIYTSPLGVGGTAQVARKTLLGQ